MNETPTDLSDLYRIVSDPQYNALRLCIATESEISGSVAWRNNSMGDSAEEQGKDAELGRDSDGG